MSPSAKTRILYSAVAIISLTAGLITAKWLNAPPSGQSNSAQTQLPVDVPKQRIDFTLKDLEGKDRKLSEWDGKVILLNFWATWCPPCRHEMPAMERLYRHYRDKGFVVLAVNQWEDPDLVFAYTGELNVFPSFPILFDPQSTVSQDYGVKGLPTSFVIDRDGRLVYRAIGGRDFDHPEILQRIGDLLAESP